MTGFGKHDVTTTHTDRSAETRGGYCCQVARGHVNHVTCQRAFERRAYHVTMKSTTTRPEVGLSDRSTNRSTDK